MLAGPRAGTTLIALIGTRNVTAAPATRTETRAVADFNAIDCSAVGELIIEQVGEARLSVEAEPRLLPKILTTVESGVLRITFAEGGFSTTAPLRFRVGVRTLERLAMRGSGDAHVGPMETSSLAVSLDGSVDAVFERLQTGTFDARLAGSTGLTIEAGRSERQTVTITGSGDYRAGTFRTDDTRITIDGSADATVFAEQHVDARIAGSASLSVRGKARLEQQVSGSGSVERVN